MQVYKNRHFQRKEKIYRDFLASDDNLPSDLTKVGLSDIRHVFFELSNMCVYAHLHPKCPVNLQRTKKVLSSKIVKKVVDELGKHNYKGFFAFHRYNEPLIDPRLFEFISYVKDRCPKAMVRILTNGFYLNQTIIDELCDLRIETLEVSAYFPEEYKRLIKLDVKFPYMVFCPILDTRISLYNKRKINLLKPCYAQVNDITINCEGKLSLCCLDWKNKYILGNLGKDSLEKIISSRKFLSVYKNLVEGKRTLDICSKCDWQR